MLLEGHCLRDYRNISHGKKKGRKKVEVEEKRISKEIVQEEADY